MKIIPLILFIFILAKVDRIFFKANHSFCVHFIDTPPSDNSFKTEGSFPTEILDQPFSYLDKGAQVYVFESQDQNYVLKFTRVPASLRSFSWLTHPFSHIFLQKQIGTQQQKSKKKIAGYLESYFLAYQYLQEETGVAYVHLHPTVHLQKKIHLKDKNGSSYYISADRISFILQRKGMPFMDALESASGNIEMGKQMIDSLFEVIISRCSKGIIDRDKMHYDNYGWLENRAMHLDIGRFSQKEEVKNPRAYQQEILHVTSPLSKYLQKNSPELFRYYQEKISQL